MTTATIPRLITAAEFAVMPSEDVRRELVNGELMTSPPPDFTHGATQANAGGILSEFARPRRAGAAFIATGFFISRNPDTVRVSDVAFVSVDKLPGDRLPNKLFPFAPDIAVEVISPSETPADARERALMWLEAGSALVWTLFPDSRSVTAYRSDGEIMTLGEDDVLDAAPVLDGFSVKVSEFFDVFW